MKKILSLFVIMLCAFGCMLNVSADDFINFPGDGTVIDNMIKGISLEGDTAADALFSSYDVYYKYTKIDNSLFSAYITDTFGDTNTGSNETIITLIPSITGFSDIDASFTKVSNKKMNFNGVSYDNSTRQGYLVYVVVVDKSDNAKFYEYKEIFEVSSSNTFMDVMAESEDIYTNYETDVVSENPETGISDYALYLVPALLVGGSILMFRRRYV